MSTEFPPVGNRLGTLAASKPLGSLVQSARRKQLNQVRSFFIVVGLLISMYSLSELAKIGEANRGAVQANNRQNLGPGQKIDDQANVVTQIRVAKALIASRLFIGVCIIVLGLLLRKFPVAATLIGLILYIAQTGLVLILNGLAENIGLIFIPIFIIFGLIRSLQTAIAFQHHDRQVAQLASPLS